jgi:hypothetical protein
MGHLDDLAGPAFDAMMLAHGFHKHHREWRRTGVVTMRKIGCEGLGQLAATVERERARRFFDRATAADQAAELAKFGDAATVALDELVRLISPDDGRAQEVYARKVEQAAKVLAGDATEPAVKETALLVAILRLECSYADAKYFRMVRQGCLGSHASREVLAWKERAGRRLESMIRTLAYMKHLEYSDLRASVARLKLAAG